MVIKYLDYLNQGGSPGNLVKLYSSRYGPFSYFYQDVTGDNTPELMLYDTTIPTTPYVYRCENGRFQMHSLASERGPGFWTAVRGIEDLNLDNIPEVIVSLVDCSGSGCENIAILEWDGRTFQDRSPDLGMIGVHEWHIQDGKNGMKEIVITGDVPGSCCYEFAAPWRLRTDTFAWDGETFSLAYRTFAPAQYRYQALQDADREGLYGNYDKAMQLYRNVIFNDKLRWWSDDQRAYLLKEYRFRLDPDIFALHLPTLEPDYSEYPRLASYAYYRIMLLHIVQGRQADAQAAYSTLQQDFANDPYGHPYVEMAASFWDAYRSTSRMYDGCAAAIAYAALRPEILDPLFGGSDQDHRYVPADVCPFR